LLNCLSFGGTSCLKKLSTRKTTSFQELTYPDIRLEFYSYLFKHRENIEDIISFHLGVHKRACKVAEEALVMGAWEFQCRHTHLRRRVGQILFKEGDYQFSLPYKVGESQHSGNAEEKLRSEVVTYIWIQDNCLKVPIPWTVCE
jgi:hypothetical protein